jgi:O-antigen ligase
MFCLMIWLLILLILINKRGFLVLVIWLLIAPVATNLINYPKGNPFIKTESPSEVYIELESERGTIYKQGATITRQDLLEPTRTLFGMLLVVYLLSAFLQRKRILPLDGTEIWMSAFIIIVLASALFKSLRVAFSLHTAFDAFIVPFIAYFLARRYVTTEDRFRLFTRAIGYLGAYLIVICLVERLITPDLLHRVRGPFPRRDFLYVVIAVTFFTVLLDFFCSRESIEQKPALPRSIQLFVICLAPVISFLTLTRGNWIGFLTSVWVFLFLGNRLIGFHRKLGAVGLTMVLIPILVIGLYVIVPEEIIEERLTNLPNVEGRVATWQIMTKEVGKAPVFGIGLQNSRGLLREIEGSFGRSKSFTSPHNSYLPLLLEIGIVGLVGYLAIFGSIIRMGLRLYLEGTHFRDRWRGLTVIAILVAYHVPSLFEHLIYHTNLMHVYVYVFVGAIAGLYSSSRSQSCLYEHPRLSLASEVRYSGSTQIDSKGSSGI